MKKIFIAFAMALAFLICGCKTTGGTSSVKNESTKTKITPSALCGEWKLESLPGFKNTDKYGVTLSILANENGGYNLNGFSGVNSFFTTLKDSADAFPIGDNLASTKMMGMQDEMEIEYALLETIALARSWKIEDGRLKITYKNTTAVFSK
ncbi:MAG: META domain-containing protein [Treponema sp.]|nr:META domain-containing protein [Spirochaetia bacterium]MDD7460268.1 META domain-containing protein [Spirochaetales bacterium]MDY5810819.1 META domain-containing protein [Treponema sp.]